MSVIQDKKIVVDNLTIYYQTAGDLGRQPLIFFNGWAATLAFSERVVRELANHFYVVIPELPGFMRSDPPKHVWVHTDFVRFACRFINLVGVKNPILMGQSFGGGIAAACVAQCGIEVKQVILVDAILSGRPENWYTRFKRHIPFITKSVGYLPFVLRRVIWSVYLGIPKDMITRENLSSYGVMAEFQASQHYVPHIDYRQIGVPLLLVWGDRDTRITNIQHAKEIHRQISSSKMVVLKGPHTILYRQPKYVVDAIVDAIS